MATFIRSDLEFILQQIAIAEQHAAGTPLNSLIAAPTFPFGLRTVDGTYNNLIAGRENYGAADQVFPRETDPVLRPAEDFDPDGPGPAPATPTSYTQTSGIVADSQPRTASNLIVDQNAATNPAADAADPDGDGFIPNVTPDAGLSAPFNSWMTLFGQFFDHGLDLVGKGGSGTVFIPLKPDDPLYDPDSHTNFMVLTRATNQPGPDGVLGTADDIHNHVNQTTPFVDQNQTYTSHPSHQAFLREYALDANGLPVATGKLLEGAGGGLATWAEIKAQAREMLGIDLSDIDVTNLPLLATDEYGRFLRGPNGYAQVVTVGPDGLPGTADDVLIEGDPLAPISTADAVRTGHAFLDDIAHTAAPRTSSGAMKTADADSDIGNAVAAGEYDDELLDAHYITGDGRGNENIGLTSVHHIFHAEHNRLADHVKDVVLATGDAAFIAQWQLPDGSWNGERIFQAARFGTEMQYQHLVFEEFARKVQPQIDIFIAPNGYDVNIDPAIVAEFAHTVYRFGHSMLTETLARTNADGSQNDIGLIQAFLNPLEFAASGATAEQAAGAIVRGMTRQVGNEIDEFVTDALRNNLLGLPLDLATINMARGRDTGVPSLNAARRQFFDATGDAQLHPYESWVDFGLGIRHPESLINFIAAYGTHSSITSQETLAGKRAAAMAIVTGQNVVLPGPDDVNGTADDIVFEAPADSVDFLNGTGAWSSGAGGVTTTGVDVIDLWVGGLAEKQLPFGGLLGSTFNFVFETQLENLQNGDRFYYLARTAGLNFLNELEQNSFAELIMLNTDAKHLPGDVFATPTYVFEAANVIHPDTGAIQDDPNTPQNEAQLLVKMSDGTIRYTGEEHVVMGGTDGADKLRAGDGDDTLWGDAGNDRLDGGAGNDGINGGDGDDIITDLGGDDVIKGNAGNDVIHGGPGFNLIIGGTGSDFIITGTDVTEVIAGPGNDFILGNKPNDGMAGNEGDDWIERGTQDGAPGDNFDRFGLDLVPGNDVFLGDGGFDEFVGEGGDDIMVGSPGENRNEGMSGFDWVTYKSNPGVYADLNLLAFDESPIPPSPNTALDRYAQVEGLSGSHFNDTLRGDDVDAATLPLAGARGSVLTNIALIDGLQELLGAGVTSFDGGNIILGGTGSDIIEGRGGDDIIDGDAWLNVRISVRDANDPNVELLSANSMTALQGAMLAGTYNPGQLQIVREILGSPAGSYVDTAMYTDIRANYDITLNADGSHTVAHARGTLTDGTDTVRNVERLQFVDRTLVLAGDNQAATGNIAVSDTTPTEDQVLTATPSLSDPNGIAAGSVQLFWQAETEPGTWLTVGSGDTFQPGDAHVGLPLRVMATFTDLLGAVETVFSEPPTAVVANVNDVPTGAPAINDTSPTEGTAINASLGTVADDDGTANAVFTYRWQVQSGAAFVDIAGATNASFTPTQAQVGLPIRVVVSYTDDHGTQEQVASAPTVVVGDLIIGTNAANVINGTAGDDDLQGRGSGDTLNGLAGADRLLGEGGNDTLNGGAGADTMSGGLGNDTYVVDDGGDIVIENAGEGTDTVQSAIGYVLGANVENLTLTGAALIDATGNALDNALTGNAAANVLMGEAGNDTLNGGGAADAMFGGAGNDIYVVDNAGDAITENAGEGTDLVQSSVSRTLSANVENLTLTGAGAINGTGNELDNVLTGNGAANALSGNSGNDTLIGGGGADVMRGGEGDDTYDVNSSTDSIIENAGEGTDLVQSSVTHTLAANVENLTLTGTRAIRGTGNDLDNLMNGNNSDNVLNGGGGDDTLNGNGGNDKLNGNAGLDTLIGGSGNDAMNGGGGSDIFVFLASFGQDRITGFDANPTGGQDMLDISALGITAATFASSVGITDVGSDTLVTIGTDSVRLVGLLNAATVTASDFILAT